MKIELRARTVCYFKISRGQLEVLKHCAKLHYDGACQRTLDRVGVPLGNLTVPAERNGLLTIWTNQFRALDDQDRAPHQDDEVDVSCTTDEIDLLAKVTEIWTAHQYPESHMSRVRQLHRTFVTMLDLCNRAYSTWKLEVEL